MNNAALTLAEIHALNDADCSCEDANRKLGHAGAHRDDADASVFEESLRLKNTLDTYEAQGKSTHGAPQTHLTPASTAKLEPSWEALSLLVNCEYRLYVLNQTTPLRNNPFLSHWVEAIQRLGGTPTAHDAHDKSGEAAITSADINLVRIELIKVLLQSRNPSQFARATPRTLHANYVLLRQTSPFTLRTYVRMLEEEGIYERTPSPPGESHDDAEAPKTNDFQRWKQSLLSRLAADPATAIPELTHLPLELSSLDLLTTLLQDRTLPALNIDPAPVIADFLQHALRALEAMSQPRPLPASPPPPSPPSSIPPEAQGDREASAPPVELRHGAATKDALVRAVRLVLLFMRNLIRKDLLPVASMYFEIQEVCVRYVWMREVRDFRAFVEEGVDVEEKGEG